jgi:alkyl hydroperoxide reductase subunit AhpC
MSENVNEIATVGNKAPSFSMKTTADIETLNATASLGDYQGKWLVLYFYPLDFSAVCPTELLALSDRYDEFVALNADLLAASTDSVYSHRAWLKTPPSEGGLGDLRFPLAADYTKEVAKAFGIYDEKEGYARRTLFIIDPESVVRYMVVHSSGIGGSVDETLRVLQALQSLQAGHMCPVNWRPGQKTIS